MAEYDIDSGAVTRAAALLRDLLQTEVPGGDFTQGSAISDTLIDGHAIITGWLTAQVQNIRDRQSLRTLQNLPASESVSDAADAILDNFFRSRAQGKFAKGAITLHFSLRVDILVPRTARFFATSSLVFYPDSNSDIFINASSLRPTINQLGQVVDYTTTIFVTAARVGTVYNIDPSRFVAFDQFNTYLAYVENLTKFSDGSTTQTTNDFIAQSNNAIALRSLINARSNDAVLLDQFSDIEQVLTIGYGDQEMSRDIITGVSNAVTLHLGGHMDIFIRQNFQEVVERLIINPPLLQTRNDNRIVILRDTAATFVSSDVRVGDILALSEGVPEAPFQYVITAVNSETELEIATRTPFSTATDEVSGTTPFSYSIGNNYPAFDNLYGPVTAIATASTSRRFKEFNRVELPARPTFLIKKVELLSPPAFMDSYKDAATGALLFSQHANAPTLVAPVAGSELSFFTEIKNPSEAQSSLAVLMLEVGWPAVDLSTYTLEVTYETQSGFDAVDAYVADRFNRPGCANTLTKAFHPIYLFASIPYRQRTTPVNALSTVVPVFDAASAASLLTIYLNTYRESEPLDVSLIATKARETSAAVAAIYPFTVAYQLTLPDGRVMEFETQDTITIHPDGTTTAALMNPTDFGLPATNYYAALKKLLLDQGVSDRVTRYRVSSDGIVFEQKS